MADTAHDQAAAECPARGRRRPLVTVRGAAVNRQRGHIALGDPNGGPPLVTFVDIGGGVLELWAHEGVDLDPDGADALAAELILWAARRRPLPATRDTTPATEVPSDA